MSSAKEIKLEVSQEVDPKNYDRHKYTSAHKETYLVFGGISRPSQLPVPKYYQQQV